MSNDLDALAVAAQQLAHAPYSKFSVGAAVEMTDGSRHQGANIENASYGLAICAERTAIFRAVLTGSKQLKEVSVCTDVSPPSSPCGACRQVLLEFSPDPTKVIVTAINPQGERRSWTLAQLLPDGFTGKELP